MVLGKLGKQEKPSNDQDNPGMSSACPRPKQSRLYIDTPWEQASLKGLSWNLANILQIFVGLERRESSQ